MATFHILTQYIWPDAAPTGLYAEHLAAGAAPTRLNFIGDEQPTVLFQNRNNFLEVFFGRRDVAADALNRLRDKRGDTPLRLRLNGLL